jgi:radical SAM-linked protein
MSFSQGFSPHPRLSFASALPVGLESEAEFADIDLVEQMEPHELIEGLNASLPTGLRIMEAIHAPLGAASLASRLTASVYQIAISERVDACRLQERVNELLTTDQLTVDRQMKDHVKRVNLRPLIHDIRILPSESAVSDDPSESIDAVARPILLLTLADGSSGKARPHEVAQLVMGTASGYEIIKVASQFAAEV